MAQLATRVLGMAAPDLCQVGTGSVPCMAVALGALTYVRVTVAAGIMIPTRSLCVPAVKWRYHILMLRFTLG